MLRALTAALVVGALLAGCASKTGGPDVDAGELDVTDKTGGIRGVVVDEAIRPLSGALVEFLCTGASNVTDASGVFTVTGLPSGGCLVRASHPLYDTVQQAWTVEAGVSEPALLKIQLTRVIFAEPYSQTQKFDGFVVCSVGFFIYASEECGEGVGVPCEVPQPIGCHRWGGQDANHAQWDFYLDGSFVRTLIVEMTWEPTSSTLKEFQLNVGNDWTCDPTCNGNPLNVTGGPAPLYATVDFPRHLTDKAGTPIELGPDTRFSTFIWPNWGCANFGVTTDPNCLQQLNVAMNQAYTMIATAFYYIPAPNGFSFLDGDVPPF